jgi:hypothetical protein
MFLGNAFEDFKSIIIRPQAHDFVKRQKEDINLKVSINLINA